MERNDTMLTAIPKHWLSWDFTVLQGSEPVAAIDVSWWRENGELTVAGSRYRVRREGLMSGAFILESAGSVLARAEKTGVFVRSFAIEHAGRHYQLRARSAFGRKFAFGDGSQVTGSISPVGLFAHRARADLPAHLPLAVQIFILWLAIILWKRDADSTAAT